MGARYDAAKRDGLPKDACAAALLQDQQDEAAGIPPKEYPQSRFPTSVDFDNPPAIKGGFHRLVRTPAQQRMVEATELATIAVTAVQAVQGLQAPKDSPR